MPLTVDTKTPILIGGIFLLLKDVPIGDYVQLAAATCGL